MYSSFLWFHGGGWSASRAGLRKVETQKHIQTYLGSRQASHPHQLPVVDWQGGSQSEDGMTSEFPDTAAQCAEPKKRTTGQHAVRVLALFHPVIASPSI